MTAIDPNCMMREETPRPERACMRLHTHPARMHRALETAREGATRTAKRAGLGDPMRSGPVWTWSLFSGEGTWLGLTPALPVGVDARPSPACSWVGIASEIDGSVHACGPDPDTTVPISKG